MAERTMRVTYMGTQADVPEERAIALGIKPGDTISHAQRRAIYAANVPAAVAVQPAGLWKRIRSWWG